MSDQHTSIEPEGRKVCVELTEELAKRFLAIERPATHNVSDREVNAAIRAALSKENHSGAGLFVETLDSLPKYTVSRCPIHKVEHELQRNGPAICPECGHADGGVEHVFVVALADVEEAAPTQPQSLSRKDAEKLEHIIHAVESGGPVALGLDGREEAAAFLRDLKHRIGDGGAGEAALRVALEEAEDRFESCDNCERPSREEDLKVVWGREAESGELVDARICLVCRLEAERDSGDGGLGEAGQLRNAAEEACRVFDALEDGIENSDVEAAHTLLATALMDLPGNRTKGATVASAGGVVLTQEDIKEIESGGCVIKEAADGTRVNVVFD